jgi:hypothetical protein
LDHQQVRALGKQGRDCLGNLAGMAIGIATAAAREYDLLIRGQSVLCGVQGMLAGQGQARREAAICQCGGDWRKLDSFWAGSDNEVDTRTGQPSP